MVIYIDVQTARQDGLKFFSALNDVIMRSGDKKGCIPIKYFKKIKHIHTGEQVEFERHIPTKNTQDKNLSPLAQNFLPVQVEEIRPTSIKRPINKNEQILITEPEQYCGQAYDDKHAWKDLELEFNDYLAEEKRNINTLQHIPSIPKHTTNVTPFKRAIFKAPEYHEVRLNIDNYLLIKSTPLSQKNISNTEYHIPHTTYYNSMLQCKPATTTMTDNNLINKDEQTTVTSFPKTVTATNKRLENEQEHEQAESRRDIEKFTFFWSSSSLFSQHYLATFHINGTTYTSAEQYMMQQKALLFGDLHTAELIMNTNFPKEQKCLGHTVCGFNQTIWDRYSMAIVRQGNYCKLDQNPLILNKLHGTIDTTIVEAYYTWTTLCNYAPTITRGA